MSLKSLYDSSSINLAPDSFNTCSQGLLVLFSIDSEQIAFSRLLERFLLNSLLDLLIFLQSILLSLSLSPPPPPYLPSQLGSMLLYASLPF